MFSVIKYILGALAVATLSQASAIESRQNPSIITSWNADIHSVVVCNAVDLQGSCLGWDLLDNQCSEVPAAFNDNVRSIALDDASTTCILYADPFCSGHSYQISQGPWPIGLSDVVDTGGFGSNGVTTARCWSPPGLSPAGNELSFYVYYCHGTGFGNWCDYQLAVTQGCTEVPQVHSGLIKSFVAPPGSYCQLYSDYLCQGTEVTVVNNPGNGNVQNGVKTFRCAGGTPP